MSHLKSHKLIFLALYFDYNTHRRFLKASNYFYDLFNLQAPVWSNICYPAINVENKKTILKACKKFFNRIGVAKNFIHVDCDPDKTTPARWRYK